MSLSLLIDIVWSGLAKKGIRLSGGEHAADLATNQMICTGDICVCTWKPCQTQNSADNPECRQPNLN